MVKYEYAQGFDLLPPQLSQYGAAGWDLVSVVYQGFAGSGGKTFYFKRPLLISAPIVTNEPRVLVTPYVPRDTEYRPTDPLDSGTK